MNETIGHRKQPTLLTDRTTGFIPLTAIPEVVKNSDKPSNYMIRAGEPSRIELSRRDDRHAQENIYSLLFDYRVTIKDETRKVFADLAQSFAKETGAEPSYQQVELHRDLEYYPNDRAFKVFFDDAFRNWLVQKYNEDSLFLEKPPYNLKRGDDYALYSGIKKLSSKEKKEKIWQDIGAFSKDRLRALFKKLGDRVLIDVSSNSLLSQRKLQIEAHERAHYIQSEILFYGSLRDLMARHVFPISNRFNELSIKQKQEITQRNPELDESEITREMYDAVTPNPQINELLVEVKDLEMQLSGLMEADSILVECALNTPIITRETKLVSSLFLDRLTSLMGDFKRNSESEKSDLEREIYKLVDSKGAKGFLQEHVQGTLVLLSKGSILSHDSDLAFDLRAWGDKGEDVVQKILSIIDTFDESYFDDLNPATLQHDIRKKIRKCLLRLTNTVRKLYSEIEKDQSGFQFEIDTKYAVELGDFQQKLQDEALEMLFESLNNIFLGKPHPDVLKGLVAFGH